MKSTIATMRARRAISPADPPPPIISPRKATEMHYHLSLKSGNAKTGPIPVSTSTSATCPLSCPFNRGGGCYAGSGPLALHWQRVTRGERGVPFAQFLEQIQALPAGQLWRHNQAGDLPGEGEAIDPRQLQALLDAATGQRLFTYTHKPVIDADGDALPSPTVLANRVQVAHANKNSDATINLSANGLAHADRLADLGIGPVCTVLPSDVNGTQYTPKGRKVILCPATQREGVTCASCQLCARKNRSIIIGFPAHGTSRRKASVIASN